MENQPDYLYELSIVAFAGEEYSPDILITSLEEPEENQEYLKRIQVIFTDASEDSAARSFCEDKQEKSEMEITYLSCPGASVAECYNRALLEADGKYTSFVDSDSEYSENCIQRIFKVISDSEITEKDYICIKPFFVKPGGESAEYMVAPKSGGMKNIQDNVKNVNLCLYSYFFRSDLLKGMKFNEAFPAEARQLFILDFIEKEKVYYYAGKRSVFYRHALEDMPNFFVESHYKSWYTETIRDCYLPYVREHYEQGKMSWELEVSILYLIYARYNCNMQRNDKKQLNEQELKEFYASVYEVLKYIRYDTIVQRKTLNGFSLPVWLKWDFMKNKARKCGDDDTLVFSGGSFMMNIENDEESELPCRYTLLNFRMKSMMIYAINLIGSQLVIDASLPELPVDWLPYLGVVVDGAKAESREVYDTTLCFGQTVARALMFRATADLDQKKQKQHIRFQVSLLDRTYAMPLTFSRPGARLYASVKASYWFFGGNRILSYNAYSKELEIVKCSKNELMDVEANFCNEIKHDGSLSIDEKKEIINYRKDYWDYYFSKTGDEKPIWITFDKLYKAGDNGEYLYHYVRENHPEIDIYYLIDENADDYKRLKSDNHVLLYNSTLSKELYLRADVILATHGDIMVNYGFQKEYERRYLRNLCNGHVVCIQHGLSVQDLATYHNAIYDNIQLYCCASKYEIQNLMQPVYGYDQNQLKLCGLARYDGLINNDKKQILITPTWRSYDANGGSACTKKTYNSYFKQSAYYRIYNSLINDPRLIACAKEYGYKIIFLLHPAMSSQMEDYEADAYVQIIAATGDMSYEKILTESSLMVTDYSGVQFDFAYMRKPILYYHPDLLPPSYEESSFYVYETMGFGPILKEQDQLVDQICEYMKNDCSMEKTYRDRADDFFAFGDHSNCERIYKDIIRFEESEAFPPAGKLEDRDSFDFLDSEVKLKEAQNLLEKQQKQLQQTEIKLQNTKDKLKETKTALLESNKKLTDIKESRSYIIGRGLTWLPRRIKNKPDSQD